MESTYTEPDPIPLAAPVSDNDLMARAQAGDMDAFAELADRYRGPLRRFFAALLADPGPADDFAQETFLRLFQTRARWQPTGTFSVYLFQIARHYYLNQRERYQSRARHEYPLESTGNDAGIELALPPRTQPEVILLEQLERERRRRAIDSLSDPLRTVFVLSHFEGLRYREIAEQLGIPEGTVKSRMAEAVRRLRITLSESDNSEIRRGE